MGPILQSSAYFLQSHCRAVAAPLHMCCSRAAYIFAVSLQQLCSATAKYIQQLCSNVIDFTRLLLPIPAPLPANIRCVCAIPGDKDYWHGCRDS